MKKILTLVFSLLAVAAAAQTKKESAIVIGATNLAPKHYDFIYSAYWATKPNQVALIAGRANVKIYYALVNPAGRIVSTGKYHGTNEGDTKVITLGNNTIVFSSTPLLASNL